MINPRFRFYVIIKRLDILIFPDFGDDEIEDLIKISAPALTANKDVDIDLTEIESEWIRLTTIFSNRYLLINLNFFNLLF